MWFSKDYWISHLFCCVGKSFKGSFEIGSILEEDKRQPSYLMNI
jgi:hypothetical protein